MWLPTNESIEKCYKRIWSDLQARRNAMGALTSEILLQAFHAG